MTWTPEQKRQYAIRKSIERRQQARGERNELPPAGPRRPAPGFTVHPDNHACQAHDITYGTDRHSCGVCGRRWKLVHGKDGYLVGWVPSPLNKAKPRVD